MKQRALLFALLALVSRPISGSAADQPAKLFLAQGAISNDVVPIWFAKDRGIFRKCEGRDRAASALGQHLRRAARGQEVGQHRLRRRNVASGARDRVRDVVGCGRQDRDADHDDGVDRRIVADDLDCAAVLVRSRRREQVDRIGKAGLGRQEFGKGRAALR